jgi:PBSX family phage terminase large subunit
MYTLTPKQMQVYQDTSRELLVFGGIRSGKTNVLLLKLLSAASKPNSRVGLFRKTLVSLKLTTLKSLIEGDGQTPPILPFGSYTHNMSEKTITLKGGGTIVYSSLEEPERIRGMTLNACFVDEATDLDEKDYITLMGRVSAKMDGVPLQIVSSCNSKSPQHWIAKRWAISGNKQHEERLVNKNLKAYCLNPSDNPFLAHEYLEMLEGWRGTLAYERDVLGKWVTPDGLVFSEFDETLHTGNGYSQYVRYYIGVDVGFVDAFCALLAGIDQDGRLHIMREVYGSRMNEQSQTTAIKELVNSVDGNVESISIDYAGMGASLIDNLNNYGLPARRAIKDRFSGLSKMRNRLASKTMTINPKCSNLLREIQTYEYKEGTEQPKDGNDHAIDALRYLVSGIDGNNVGDIVVSEERIKESLQKMTNSYSDDEWDHPSFRRM